MRPTVGALVVLLLAACTPNVHASGQNESRSRATPVRTATVCELAHWGQNMVGVRVRVRAEYFTDLRHGAFLSDRGCPSDRLQLATDAADADKSVSVFNDTTSGHGRYYIGHKFAVDVTGIFEWSKEQIINKELLPDRQYRIPPHGMLSLLKVWSFEKPGQRKAN